MKCPKMAVDAVVGSISLASQEAVTATQPQSFLISLSRRVLTREMKSPAAKSGLQMSAAGELRSYQRWIAETEILE